jgi:hypothetical protein
MSNCTGRQEAGYENQYRGACSLSFTIFRDMADLDREQHFTYGQSKSKVYLLLPHYLRRAIGGNRIRKVKPAQASQPHAIKECRVASAHTLIGTCIMI